MKRVITALALVVAIAGFVALRTAGVAAATSARIMSGLNNPRGLTIGPDGGIYVAEAGTGGGGPCLINAQNETRCFGPSGSISRFLNGAQQRLFTQFSSHALPNGSAALGPSDVAFQGNAMYVLMGLGLSPTSRASFGGAGEMFGKLLQVSATGQLTEAADVSAYERDVNPAGGVVDTNPFGLLLQATQRVVADAGANALLSVAPSGLVNTIAVFPSRPDRATDAVSTSVVVGPDGAYYVGQLTGVPFTAGAANVFRVVPHEAPQVFRSGFTTITDIDFGPDGSLYVLEHSTGPAFFALPGDIVRITPAGVRTIVVSNLDRPTSLAVASDGSIYYTNVGITPGAGEVWKFTP